MRAKALGSGAFLAAAAEIVERANAAGALLIVNDRADVARIAGAAGVHVGQDDVTPTDARRLVGEEAIVGLSTHTPAQIAAAVTQPVSYVAVGPVFGTATKSTGYEAVGLHLVATAARAAQERHLPVVAIGGISLEAAPSVIDAGASSVAVISDLFTGGRPADRVRAFLSRLR